MAHTVLYDDGKHRNILLEDFTSGGLAVQSNQHVVVDAASGMILDPGGHKIYAKVLAASMSQLGKARLETIFLSHQDPDIVAAINGWLMTTDAKAYVSSLWTRFVPHFGLDRLVEDRLLPIPDPGMRHRLGSCDMIFLPAHFLHSPGNFQVYDPIAKILYSGDLGASIGPEYVEVQDFEAHVESMAGFHRRYMSSGRVMRAWAKMVRTLDIDIIAPQHGALFRGKPMVEKFIAWCEGLSCGVDTIEDVFRVPA
ncbi:MAG: FprA family A-type flavoprotein [Deltaproteobacteria bacterium]|nr:FprA family A-type flavoprotein [Deltaproteobacteria bacterium]